MQVFMHESGWTRVGQLGSLFLKVLDSLGKPDSKSNRIFP